MPQFTVTTLGCKVNQYEAAAMAATLRQAGLTDFAGRGPLALCLVHTCCVTAAAAGKSRRLIRRLAGRHPESRIIVTGCCGTALRSEFQHLPGVVAVLGVDQDIAGCLRALTGQFRDLPSSAEPSLRQVEANRYDNTNEAGGLAGPMDPSGSTYTIPIHGRSVKEFRSESRSKTSGLPSLTHFDQRHRAIVKAQDGCDAFCSYCIVPVLRSRIWSRSIETIRDEVATLVSAGHREIVLCGICLGAYGRASTRPAAPGEPPGRLAELIDRLAETPGLERLRLSSLHPSEITDRLLDVLTGHANICPHLHLSLQSGSAAILARMNRPYSPAEFLETVGRLRARLDRPAITTDVIVGFPGESDRDFADTLEVCRKAGFSKMHLFPYSPRKGTAAWQWRSESPPPDVVKARCAELAELEKRLAEEYRRQFVGEIVQVLVEGRSRPAGDVASGESPKLAGFTPRYVRVELTAGETMIGQVAPVHVTGLTDHGLAGQLGVP